MFAYFQKVCETLSLADVEKGIEGALVGAEAVRRVVREELARAAAPAEETVADRVWERLESRGLLKAGRPAPEEGAERVLRVVDSRIDQFLARHLKSKDLAERITAISRSEARLTHAASVERLRHDLEARLAHEVEKAVDDLLRSDALADRIRLVAGEVLKAHADGARGASQAAAS